VLAVRSIGINLKHEIPPILKQGGGAIVNISSGAKTTPEMEKYELYSKVTIAFFTCYNGHICERPPSGCTQ
jgi:short-subunit dehydrogenase